jgi:type II secretory ATPase GspE/PulE/Tfp pilus assembly ATPase PilB-like protein
MNPAQIKEILIKESYISEADVKAAEEYIKDNPTTEFVDYVISRGVITRSLFGQAVAESYGLAFADLSTKQPTKEQVLKINDEVAKEFRIVYFAEHKNEIVIATDNPKKEGLQEKLHGLFPAKKIILAYALPEDIDQVLVFYLQSLETRFAKIIEAQERVAPEILEEIFNDALTFKSSDIHFEPQEKEVVIRFRVDGVLREAGKLTKELYENILNRIKVQAHLRIDDHFSAQDGSLRYEREGLGAVDMRISITPIMDGEKVVIRVLAEYVRSLSLLDLGLSESDQVLLMKASKKPFGMILVSGPTGSGKTTTLYAVLKILNHPNVNVTTIEDPVEYKIVGANQIQVNTGTNLTFAKGLRSIVRQDPDIILVGEIRDTETAEIAVNAALTGHILLSTFHANDAVTAIPRLLDMGIEPFLLSSTLQLLIAQRLVRRLCTTCRYSVQTKLSDLKKITSVNLDKYFPADEEISLYQSKGCNVCNNTGFKGRIAIYEFILVSPEIQDLILKAPSSKELWDLASSQGSKPLFEDGLEKVKNGITTLEELLRVAVPPSQNTQVNTAQSERPKKAKK